MTEFRRFAYGILRSTHPRILVLTLGRSVADAAVLGSAGQQREATSRQRQCRRS
jgi:hypothetical protein